jgi:transposase
MNAQTHYINIGIDLGIKAINCAQIRDENGRKIGHDYSFYTTKESLDKICAKAQTTSPEAKIRLIFEATGMAWFPVAIYGKTRNYSVTRVKTQKTCYLRKVYDQHNKYDKLDTKTLTMMPIVDCEGTQEVYLAPAKTFALSRRCRQRERLVDTITAQKNRIRSFFDWVFPGLPECFSDPFGKVAKMFYRYYPNPFKVKDKTAEELAEDLSTVTNEKVDLAMTKAICEVAARVGALYENSDEYVDFEELARELLPELELLEAYQTQLEEVESEVERLYEAVHPSKHIESLPGISEKLGASLRGVIGDPHRFDGSKRCRAFIGFIPRQDSSGNMDKKGLPMSQAGPNWGRRDFYLAADIGRQWDPQLAKVYYEEMVYKGHCHTQAVCAVAVRMISRVLRILKDSRDYEFRDISGRSISKKEAKAIVKERYTVPEEVRRRLRNRKKRERNNLYKGLSRDNRGTPNLPVGRQVSAPRLIIAKLNKNGKA